MMKNFLALASCLVLFVFNLEGQRDLSKVIFTNSQDVDRDRYDEIKGTPYLFEHYVLATIVSSNIDVYENILVNYNGYTKGFEAYEDNKFIELDARWYLRVEIDPQQNPVLVEIFGEDKLIFQRGIHPKFENIFVQVLYAGLRTTFFKVFEADLTKQKIEIPGQTLNVERFVEDIGYYLVDEGGLEPVTLRKKSLLKAMGKGKAKTLENFAEENEIDFASEREVIKFIDYYDKNF